MFLSLARLTQRPRKLFCVIALLIFIASSAATSRLYGQSESDANRTAAAAKTHANDFDYLLGDWEFTGTNKQYGQLHGAWSAARVGNSNQVIDEYRVLGDKGETYYFVITIRAYDKAHDRWDLVSLEPGIGLQNVGTGRRDGDEVHIDQTFMLPNGSPSILRIRYHDIQTDHFLWSADHSLDGGKTWAKSFQELQVRRKGPPRSIDSLLPTK